MSNVKITDLPSLTGASAASTDVLPVVDVSADTTSKMTRAEFFQNVPAINVVGAINGASVSTASANITGGAITGITDLAVADGGTGASSAATALSNLGGAPLASPAFTGQASFADGSASAPSIAHTGDLNAGIFFPAVDTVAITTAGSERMRVDASGNVGIGVTPSAWISAFKAMQFADAGSVSAISNELGVNANSVYLSGTNWTYKATDFATQYRQSSGQHKWLNAPSGTAGNAITFTQAMTLDASGNLGIGTSSPSNKLEVFGNASSVAEVIRNQSTTSSTSAGLAIGANNGATQAQLTTSYISGGSTFQISSSGTIGSIYIDFDTQVFRNAAGLERMRIDASGNVGIGNTAPVTKFHVTGASMTTGVVYQAQPAQTSKAAAATLTIAELLTGIIQYTGAVATLTLPTGTSIEGGLPTTFPIDMSFDVSFINTGAALLTIGANGNTTVGTMTVATLTSAILRFRKTATNTYTVYRIS